MRSSFFLIAFFQGFAFASFSASAAAVSGAAFKYRQIVLQEAPHHNAAKNLQGFAPGLPESGPPEAGPPESLFRRVGRTEADLLEPVPASFAIKQESLFDVADEAIFEAEDLQRVPALFLNTEAEGLCAVPLEEGAPLSCLLPPDLNDDEPSFGLFGPDALFLDEEILFSSAAPPRRGFVEETRRAGKTGDFAIKDSQETFLEKADLVAPKILRGETVPFCSAETVAEEREMISFIKKTAGGEGLLQKQTRGADFAESDRAHKNKAGAGRAQKQAGAGRAQKQAGAGRAQKQAGIGAVFLASAVVYAGLCVIINPFPAINRYGDRYGKIRTSKFSDKSAAEILCLPIRALQVPIMHLFRDFLLSSLESAEIIFVGEGRRREKRRTPPPVARLDFGRLVFE